MYKGTLSAFNNLESFVSNIISTVIRLFDQLASEWIIIYLYVKNTILKSVTTLLAPNTVVFHNFQRLFKSYVRLVSVTVEAVKQNSSEKYDI